MIFAAAGKVAKGRFSPSPVDAIRLFRANVAVNLKRAFAIVSLLKTLIFYVEMLFLTSRLICTFNE
ncbi:hypothetical protein GG681_11495 [Epibacterium sp. SM1969]|uniref:Uncharacterized protein n=1 Tax=Tritonibacter aquimaris TaxID=2663379 RepID=A0A844B1J9_9RHOB|nr:hypothetical protein [Tritonibacter aquimaris]